MTHVDRVESVVLSNSHAARTLDPAAAKESAPKTIFEVQLSSF